MIEQQDPQYGTIATGQEAQNENSPSEPQAAQKGSRRRKKGAGEKKMKVESGPAEAQETNDRSLVDTVDAVQANKLAVQGAWPARIPGEEGMERRLSFVVRLMVDENGEPRRTEIQDAQTMKIKNYYTLDGEQLAAFMRASLSSMDAAERIPPEAQERSLQDSPAMQAARHYPALKISDVRVFRSRNGDTLMPALPPEQALTIQVQFELQNAWSDPLTDQDQSFRILIFANQVPGRQSQLLTQYAGILDKDRYEQEVRLQAPGLSSGIYRLSTQITLDTPERVTGFYKGPVLFIH